MRKRSVITFLLLIIIFSGIISDNCILIGYAKESDGKSTSTVITVGSGKKDDYHDILSAVNAAVPGDTILVRDGEYTGSVTIKNSGAEKKPISIKAEGTKAVLYGDINIKADNICLDGLHLIGRKDGVLWRSGETFPAVLAKGSNIRITNLDIREAFSLGISGDGKNIYVADNYIRDCSMGITTGGSDSVYERNELEALGTYTPERGGTVDFFRVFGENITIRNNYCHGIKDGDHLGNSHVDFVQAFDNNRVKSRNILVENNLVTGFFHQGFMLENSIYPEDSYVRDWTIRNNIVSGYTSWGVCGGKPVGGIPNITIENNIFIGFPGSGFHGIALRGYKGYGIIRNNMIINGGDYGAENGSRLSYSGNNLIYGSKSNHEGSNDIVGKDPHFKDPENNDFHLLPDSPAIDAGTDVNHQYDRDGAVRPYGDRVDIGPYEFTGIKSEMPADSISLDSKKLTMGIGDTGVLSATILPINSTTTKIKWKSSAPSIVKVDTNGQLTAKSKGSATITATVSGTKISTSCKVTVKKLPSFRGIQLGSSFIQFKSKKYDYSVKVPYNTESLRLIPEYVSGSVLLNNSLIPNGKESGRIQLNPGDNFIELQYKDLKSRSYKYIITVTRTSTLSWKASDGFSDIQGLNQWYYLYKQPDSSQYTELQWSESHNKWVYDTQYNCNVEASGGNPDMSKNSVRAWKSPYDGTVKIKGTIKKINPYGNYINAVIMKNDSVVWGSKSVTQKKKASHNITIEVKAGDMLYFIVSKVQQKSNDYYTWNPVVSMQINPVPSTEITLDKDILAMEADTVGVLNATVLPDTAQNKEISWRSSDKSVVTVDEYGSVKAVAEGTATIYANIIGTELTAECQIKVVKKYETWSFIENFSSKQGKNQWYYYYQTGANKYKKMKWAADIQQWLATKSIYKCRISSGLFLADSDYGAVAAWKAPKDGNITITGMYKKNNVYRDTSKLLIKKNKDIIWGPVSLTDGRSYNDLILVEVKKGDKIFFINSAGADGSYWEPVITYKVE